MHRGRRGPGRDHDAEDAASTSSATGADGGSSPTLPRLGARGTVRFVWRQLTSMRTALFLLLLLAVAAVPGSVVPQEGVDPTAVATFRDDHTVISPWLDRLGFFDVYASPWFSAIYLLLFVSLVGCVVPRSRQHWTAWRARPPRTPARLERLPEHRRLEVPAPAAGADDAAGDALGRAAAVLRRRRYRVDVRPDRTPDGHAGGAAGGAGGTGSVAAERGYLRETGNLVFHLSLVGLLLSLAATSLLSYRAQVLLAEGEGFSNSVVEYDTFDPGAWVDPADLPPFSVSLEDLDVSFEESAAGNQFGAPRSFDARVTVQDAPDDPARIANIRVNEPLSVDGAQVYLAGNGYAPVITVRDATGEVVYSEPTPFLAADAAYNSNGVVKVLGSEPEQLGFTGIFMPTALQEQGQMPRSVFPDLRNPLLVLTGYAGDLGAVNQGAAVNVYRLDTDEMTQLTREDGSTFAVALRPGDTVQLPDGRGSISVGADVPRYAALNVRHDPGRLPALVFSATAILGLVASLFVPRRRLFVTVRRDGTDAGALTVVQVAGLARGEDERLAEEVDAVTRALGDHLAAGSEGSSGPGAAEAHAAPSSTRSTTDDTAETASTAAPRS